jgi:hypothetical protein
MYNILPGFYEKFYLKAVGYIFFNSMTDGCKKRSEMI